MRRHASPGIRNHDSRPVQARCTGPDLVMKMSLTAGSWTVLEITREAVTSGVVVLESVRTKQGSKEMDERGRAAVPERAGDAGWR